MKLISYRGADGAVCTGVVVDERVLDISEWIGGLPISEEARCHNAAAGITAPAGGILRWLQSAATAIGAIDALAAHLLRSLREPAASYLPLADLHLYAPVPRPGKIIGVGRNYADHVAETGAAAVEKPRIIFKVPSSVAAPGAVITRPALVRKMDFEVELAVLIGGYGKNVVQAQALSLVAGYTLLNDLSAREFQFDINPAQTTFAKSMDGFAPMGPWLVTSEEITDPQSLDVSLWLNGVRMQHGHTKDMIFSVTYLIAYLSQYMTLEPGDVITTGTPAGVGAFRKPPVYLQPGDRLRYEVSQIGAMEHLIQ